MATPKKKTTKKLTRKGRTARAYRFARGDTTTARAKKSARKTARKTPLRTTLVRGEHRPSRKPARKTAATKRRAPLIPPHAASPRPGKPCEVCGEPHSKRAHGSHAKGKKLNYSYKTRRAGIFAIPRIVKKAIRKMSAKKPARKRAARRRAA